MNWTPDRMLSRLDGDTELASQLVAIFIDEYPRMLERLRGAVAAGSARPGLWSRFLAMLKSLVG